MGNSGLPRQLDLQISDCFVWGRAVRSYEGAVGNGRLGDDDATNLTSAGNMWLTVPIERWQFLEIYQKLSGRTLIDGALPEAKIVFHNQTPLTHLQALQAFDTLLAQHDIAIVYVGEDTVKAVPVAQINSEALPEINLPWQLLPESSSPMLRKVYLKKLKPSIVVPLLMPFAKLPGSILAVDDQKLLVLRDYSENIRQQLRLLEELEKKP